MYPRRTAGKWQKISAGGWNAAMRAAEDLDARLHGSGLLAASSLLANRTIVDVRNNTGSLMQRSYVLGIDEWTFDPDSGDQLEELHENLRVDGIVPVLGTHDEKFVVLPGQLEDGEIGPAVLSGIVLVLVNIAYAEHTFCTVADGDVTTLASSFRGRGRILRAQEGTGSKWCLVELGPMPSHPIFAVTNGAVSPEAEVTVERLKPKDTSPFWQRSGETYTARDIWLNSGESIESGTILSTVPFAGREVIASIYCSAADWL